MLLPHPLLPFFLLSASVASALRLTFDGHRIPVDERPHARRSSLSGSTPLDDSADLSYSTNISVGGVSFDVVIDTGSSDLWVAGSVPGAAASGKAATLTYAIGNSTGPIKTAPLVIAGHTVVNQAFIEVSPDADHPAGDGLIGLGPSSNSVIYNMFDEQDQGNTPLDNIFIQDKATPNYITFLLGRLNDPDVAGHFPGDLTIGELLPNHTDITNQPKLPVTEVSFLNTGNQHFQAHTGF